MANRSDFYKAKLPRVFKRALIMGEVCGADAHKAGEIRKMFVEAHKAHLAFKNRRSDQHYRDADSVEE